MTTADKTTGATTTEEQLTGATPLIEGLERVEVVEPKKLYVIVRGNNLYDEQVPLIEAKLKEQGCDVKTQIFPANTTPKEIEIWLKANQQDWEDRSLIVDKTTQNEMYSFGRSSDQKFAFPSMKDAFGQPNKNFDEEIAHYRERCAAYEQEWSNKRSQDVSLDYLFERMSGEAIRSAIFGAPTMPSGWARIFADNQDTNKESFQQKMESIREAFTALFKKMLLKESPENIYIVADDNLLDHTYSEFNSDYNRSPMMGDKIAYEKEQVAQFMQQCLLDAGAMSTQIKIVPEGPREVEGADTWILVDRHSEFYKHDKFRMTEKAGQHNRILGLPMENTLRDAGHLVVDIPFGQVGKMVQEALSEQFAPPVQAQLTQTHQAAMETTKT